MNEHFGWRQGGRTVAIYTHLSGKQVDDQIIATFGKKRIDTQTYKIVDIIICSRCGLQNTPASIQCGKCGFPLSDKTAMVLHERRQRADMLMDRLTSQPEFKQLLQKVLDDSNKNMSV
jgi:ribosomal protein L40E